MIINLILIVLLINSVLGKNSNIIGCGLVGFSSFKDKKANPMILKFLLLHNLDRGKDALGIYTKETGIIKKSGNPKDLLAKEEFKIPKTNQFIGHVRTTSSGGMGDNRAHPFNRGNIILAMNGTISNHYTLCVNEYKIDVKDLWVDSDYLTAMLNKTQSKEPLTKIDGSCACIYIDNKTDVMYIYRNIERPLFRGYLEEGMYISSTKESLESMECSKIAEFKENILYEIVNGSIDRNYPVKRYVKPEVVHTPVNSTITQIYDPSTKKYYKSIQLNIGSRWNLYGEWLRPINDFITDSNAFFSKDKRYLVVNDIMPDTLSMRVKHPDGQTYTVLMLSFEPKVPLFELNDDCFVTSNIYVNGTDRIFARVGDLVSVVEVIPVSKWVWIQMADGSGNKIHFTGNHKDFIRHATIEEINYYWQFDYVGQDEKLIDSYKNEDKKPANTNPVIIQPKPLTALEKYEKELDELDIMEYSDLINIFLTRLESVMDGIENVMWADYGKEEFEQMRSLVNWFKESDKTWVSNEEPIDNTTYGG